jgi:hypothetical protein
VSLQEQVLLVLLRPVWLALVLLPASLRVQALGQVREPQPAPRKS